MVAFLVTKHVACIMVLVERGSIVIIASICGVTGGMLPYSFTNKKHTVVGMCREGVAELGWYSVSMNCMSP
ncbi:hypothetical protein Taro_055487 [Colocasia esculenta]|uniref:Uncharacterized protein n=1 Tax=Colocasia esculenta TaxID=4460 RepID=A0A843XUC9_COLES|nr:hypothetical protein [Colocasia esculenta]